ncbi:unnamed protein product [Chondrus crispus]|uniref:Uncharacterized protein n=1 Tax=Chondrus crispus TaxID=2769 RepID=R7Q2Q4_CHOCR|nr:unnamed protein product [Chondrus crispus]CDF32168.1 unnamed protein product [Chondrus crispus]|eukprot:XP_005711833.1 unnamed protein product [Chondrus crispus]
MEGKACSRTDFCTGVGMENPRHVIRDKSHCGICSVYAEENVKSSPVCGIVAGVAFREDEP